jgi:hypothetical protein
MYLRTFFFYSILFFCTALQAQTVLGVWEGSFNVRGSKKNKLNVRMELMQTENQVLGIITTRGFEKKTVYGCDYLVTGNLHDKKLRLTRASVRRGVAMSKTECGFFTQLELQVNKTDTATSITVAWIWDDEERDVFTAVKTDPEVSASAKDEIYAYVEELYNSFEQTNLFMAPAARLNQNITEFTADSTELLLDFYSVEKSMHDSISVFLNGDTISSNYYLFQKPLRIRLQQIDTGMNEIVVISESVGKPTLQLRFMISQGTLTKEFILTPGFVRNAVVWINRKPD